MTVHATDYVKLQDLSVQKEELELQLATLYEEWESLSLQLEDAAP
jgi:hypothetical protein